MLRARGWSQAVQSEVMMCFVAHSHQFSPPVGCGGALGTRTVEFRRHGENSRKLAKFVLPDCSNTAGEHTCVLHECPVAALTCPDALPAAGCPTVTRRLPEVMTGGDNRRGYRLLQPLRPLQTLQTLQTLHSLHRLLPLSSHPMHMRMRIRLYLARILEGSGGRLINS